jgi:putative transposase
VVIDRHITQGTRGENGQRFCERLWRTVKYEDIYLWGYETVPQLRQGLLRYFTYYNEARLHQALDYRTPAAVYQGGRPGGRSAA